MQTFVHVSCLIFFYIDSKRLSFWEQSKITVPDVNNRSLKFNTLHYVSGRAFVPRKTHCLLKLGQSCVPGGFLN
jgi:hypothetical protein